ncbi:uncharacterized protein [Triticum aestivum]|uniref:uncharacterized protein n=1 Tax=Triticum aestivum TaxID=4565 RepID=UPI001D02164B|nr:uncharacterized protein LOC123107536 [Triticum aestivum]
MEPPDPPRKRNLPDEADGRESKKKRARSVGPMGVAGDGDGAHLAMPDAPGERSSEGTTTVSDPDADELEMRTTTKRKWKRVLVDEYIASNANKRRPRRTLVVVPRTPPPDGYVLRSLLSFEPWFFDWIDFGVYNVEQHTVPRISVYTGEICRRLIFLIREYPGIFPTKPQDEFDHLDEDGMM